MLPKISSSLSAIAEITHPNIVLIDDCSDFCNILKAYAKKMQIKLKTFLSLADMYTFAKLKSYDLFWCVLKAEIDKVNSFYLDAERICVSKFDELNLDYLTAPSNLVSFFSTFFFFSRYFRFLVESDIIFDSNCISHCFS